MMDELCISELRAALDGVGHDGDTRMVSQPSDSEAPGSPHSESKTLWMGDLAYWMDEAFLTQVFSTEGEVTSVKVIRNKTSGLSEGYGFIDFQTRESAAKALNNLNGTIIPETTDQAFRLNWGAYGMGKSGSEGFSVFVGDLAHGVTEAVLQERFKKRYPSVRSAKVITDANTGRHKGYGFVRFASQAERDKSLEEMQGHVIESRPIRISAATAKKSSSFDGTSSSTSISPAPFEQDSTNCTLFIGGLSEEVTEIQLFTAFSSHGEIVYTKIPQGRGCGFVQFVHRKDAEEAKAALHGVVVGSNPIRVSWGRQQGKRTQPHLPHFPYHQPFDCFPGYYDNTTAYYDPYATHYAMMPMEVMYSMYPPALPVHQPHPFMSVPSQPFVRMDMPGMQPYFGDIHGHVPRMGNFPFDASPPLLVGHHLPVS